MAKYKAYPEYKDSGVEWLGDIPSHWIKSKFGYLKTILTDYTANGSFADLKSNVTYLDDPSYARLVRLTDLRHDLNNSNGVWVDKNSYNYLSKSSLYGGEFLLANVGAYAGLFYQMPYNKGPASLAPNMFMAKFSHKKISSEFIAYVGQADNISKQLILKATASSAQPKLNKDDFKSIYCCYPPLNEQKIISVFLDHETAKIDNLIEKQQQLIELLKEKRQAVISHAVTKGLNPDVPMKDSGVEWLGEVPEHWTVTRLGYHAIKIGSGKTPRGGSEIYLDEGVLFLRSQNIYDDGLRVGSSECVFIDFKTHNDMKGTRVLEGDILLNITGGSIGRSCIVPTPFIEANVNQHVCILRFTENIRDFISYAMKSSSTKEQIEACQVGGNRDGLNFEQTSKINICLPPEEEIGAVLGYLKIRLPQLDTLEKNAKNIILLLQERRTALISAAVTGKIDVRDWVAPATQDTEVSQEATA